MSSCRICAKVRRWLGMDHGLGCEAVLRSHWSESDAWERAHSNDDELWWKDSDRSRALIHQAYDRQDADPQGALTMFVEAAEAGSPHAMEAVGSYYETGTVVTADFDQAADHYYRAICAGSWMATIAYARLLAAHGDVDKCDAVLRDGVELDFVPAYFWLAWLRFERTPTRATCRAIRPLLDYAANQGHPGAKKTLGTLMTKGKFGLLAIPRGLKLILETMPPILRADAAAAGNRLKSRALEAAAP